MTAMRLKRYPSPSGGIALGKMGVGATMMRSSPLPPGARWVEYLESTGTQYVDTGLNFNRECTFSFDIVPLGGAGTINFGYNDGSAELLLMNDTSQYYFLGRQTNGPILTRYVLSRVDSKISADGNWLKINGNTVASNTTAPRPNHPMYIFGADLVGNSKMRISRFEASNNSDRIVLYPIAIGTTGYMLDLVSGEYLPYGNKGTGDFTIGPDTNAPAI